MIISGKERHILRMHQYVAFSFDIISGLLYNNLTTYCGTVSIPDRQNP